MLTGAVPGMNEPPDRPVRRAGDLGRESLPGTGDLPEKPMKIRSEQRRRLVAAASLLPFCLGAAARAGWPDKAIKWIVPYPAGGGTDSLARTLADAMSAALGQPLVIENKPGAATNIGAETVATSPPDGYTIMSADNAMLFFNEHLFGKLPYSPENDFTYVGAIGRTPLALTVHPDFPARNLDDFLAHVRARPGKVNFASVGIGSPHHLAMEMFRHRTGIDIVHVPYKGSAPALQDFMAGHVKVMFMSLVEGLPVLHSGKARALAIGVERRSPMLPETPTLAEAGVRDAEVFAMQGVVAPARLPPDVTTRLNETLNQALASAPVRARFRELGTDPTPGSPEAFRQSARAEARRWGPVIKAAGITVN